MANLSKKKLERFFDDIDLGKSIGFTQEEHDIFDSFEWEVLQDNGLGNISGGYSKVTVYDQEEDYDEDDNETPYLICETECGKQDMGGGGSSCDKWEVKYDRKNKTFA